LALKSNPRFGLAPDARHSEDKLKSNKIVNTVRISNAAEKRKWAAGPWVTGYGAVAHGSGRRKIASVPMTANTVAAEDGQTRMARVWHSRIG